MDLSALALNATLREQLERQFAARGLSHAYILTGGSDDDRMALARTLASAMVCTHPEESRRPCGECSACRKVRAGIHPDVVTADETGSILRVETIRALRADAYIRPNESERKVFLLPGAERMNPSAQNAMLKLLEEGPAYDAFLLLTDNAAALLPTVRSRCETLTLAPRSDDEPGEDARTLARAVAAGDELVLAEACARLEQAKRPREEIIALFDGLAALASGAVTSRTGAVRPLCEETLLLQRALPDRDLLRLVSLCRALRSAAAFNVSAGHLTGRLCTAWISGGTL